MALLRAHEVRAMTPEDRKKKLVELRGDLMHERGVAAMGGSPPSPGKIRQIRTAIARILTIDNQSRAGAIEWAKGETPKTESAHAKRPKAVPKPAAKAAAKPKPAPKAPAKKSQASKPKAHKAPAKRTSKKEAKTGGMDE